MLFYYYECTVFNNVEFPLFLCSVFVLIEVFAVLSHVYLYIYIRDVTIRFV